MTTWVKIRRWHIFRTWTRVPNRVIVLCSRRTGDSGQSPEIVESAEAPGPTCASCRRVQQRMQENA